MSDENGSDDVHSSASQHGGGGLTPQVRLVLAVVLACALIAAISVGVIVVTRYAEDDAADQASASAGAASEEQARKDVQAAVSSFVANINSYSVGDIDGYRDRLTPLLTQSFAQSFDLAVENIVDQVKATEMTSEGEVLATAVSSVDRDNATALVVADAHVTSALGERLRHFRWKVSLVKQGDDWLVDDFKAVE